MVLIPLQVRTSLFCVCNVGNASRREGLQREFLPECHFWGRLFRDCTCIYRDKRILSWFCCFVFYALIITSKGESRSPPRKKKFIISNAVLRHSICQRSLCRFPFATDGRHNGTLLLQFGKGFVDLFAVDTCDFCNFACVDGSTELTHGL